MDIKKIPNDVIENFEKHYTENVIQPITKVNGIGEIISYIYSNQSKLTEENYTKRVYKGTLDNGHHYWTSKYGMVYFEIHKQIRYDYMFYDEQQEKQITTFAIVNTNSDNCNYIFENNNNCVINTK